MELKIGGNRGHFYQWDTGQILIVEDAGDCEEIHFSSKVATNAMVCKIREESGARVADVPNILLQSDATITAYLFRRAEDGTQTLHARSFPVISRPKPEDYVYTETEVLSYNSLDKRLTALEGEGLANAIAAYLEENPVEAGATAEEAAQIAQNKTNIEKLTADKLDADKLPEAVNDALAQAKASGDFKGDPGEPGKDGADGAPGADGKDGNPGADGYTPVKGEDYFTPEEVQEIAEQAAGMVDVPETSMQPLTLTGAVEATYDGSKAVSVEIPSGGESFTGEFVEIVNHTVTADEATARSITFTQASYPLINGQKTLLAEIVKPETVVTGWFNIFAGSVAVLGADGASWKYWRGATTVNKSHWLSSNAFGTNILVADRLAPGYTFSGANELGYSNKAYVHYTSLTISSYQAFLEEGTKIRIYGGK